VTLIEGKESVLFSEGKGALDSYYNGTSTMDPTLWGRLSSLPCRVTQNGRLESLPHNQGPLRKPRC